MGGCPCPRCTIKKEDFHALGTLSDGTNRYVKLRHDNDGYRARVEEARDNIYWKGYTLNSEPGVERLLKEDSLVPTLVSHPIPDIASSHVRSRMHFRMLLRNSTLMSSELS